MAGRKKRAPRRKPFDPTTLFENRLWTFPRPYPTLRASLNAVASGKKGMEFVSYGMWQLEDAPHFAEQVGLALDRGLSVVLHRTWITKGDQGFEMYIARPEQLWRVPAHLAFDEAIRGMPWSDVTESMQSVLFGYDAEQRREWIADRRQRVPETGVPIFTLLNEEQRATVEDLGMRCFGPSSTLEGLSFIARVRYPKKNALKLAPRGFTIARVGLAWPVYDKIWPREEHKTRRVERPRAIPKKLARAFNAALTTNVQFFTAKGWV